MPMGRCPANKKSSLPFPWVKTPGQTPLGVEKHSGHNNFWHFEVLGQIFHSWLKSDSAAMGELVWGRFKVHLRPESARGGSFLQAWKLCWTWKKGPLRFCGENIQQKQRWPKKTSKNRHYFFGLCTSQYEMLFFGGDSSIV